MMLYVKIVLHF